MAFDTAIYIAELIGRLADIEGPMKGDLMEMGRQDLDQGGDLVNEVVQVPAGGRILMPARFHSMKELLGAIETAVIGNTFT